MLYLTIVELVKTVKCKLQVTSDDRGALLDTLLKYSQACNDALDVALEKGITNNITLHHECYYTLKERYGLTSNYVCRCFPRVTGAIKAAKHKRRKPKLFRPTSLDLDNHLFRLIVLGDDFGANVSTMAGRRKIRLDIGNYQRGWLAGQKPTSATLNYTSKREFYINIVLSEECPAPNPTGRKGKTVGVDVGIANLASTSTGLKFSGKQAMHIRREFRAVRESLQAKGTASSRRVLKRLSGREQRWMRDLNHCISKQIVDSLQPGDTIVLEDLTHIRDRTKVRKEQRAAHHSWAFRQLQSFVEYKAAWEGINVVYIDPAYTSKACSKCGQLGSRSGHRFSCATCGHRAHADLNSCHNLLRRAESQFAPSERPSSTGPQATHPSQLKACPVYGAGR